MSLTRPLKSTIVFILIKWQHRLLLFWSGKRRCYSREKGCICNLLKKFSEQEKIGLQIEDKYAQWGNIKYINQ